MNRKQMLQNNSSQKSFSLIPKPAPAWTAILILSFVTAVLIFTGAGAIANIIFPFGSAIVGVFLYYKYPILYNGFVWWIWFLVALIRRLADYYASYTEPSPLLLAPYLVTGITLITVVKHLPKAHLRGLLPFTIVLIGIFYGFLIGLINFPAFTVFRSLLDWLVPVTYGFHLLVNWRNFGDYQQNIQRVFTWGILIMGIYGIIQFLSIPEWDRLWLDSSEMFSAAGRADESGGTRIWSTMHSGEPFAAVMAGGLLMLFNRPGILNLSASGIGYLAFLLTTVRSAWIAWFAGALTLIGSLKAKYQMRLIVTVLVLIMLVVPLATMEQFSGKLGERFSTFSNLEQDGSLDARQGTFNAEFGYAISNFTGDGIGTKKMDSALLSGFISLGWFGTICYCSGLFMLTIKLFIHNNKSNLFFITGRAIIITCLIRIPVNFSSINGVGGVLLWGFLGLTIASKKHYKHRHIINDVSDNF